MYSSIHSLTSALDGGEWSASHPGRFTSRERAPGTHWLGGWVIENESEVCAAEGWNKNLGRIHKPQGERILKGKLK
jgi:hypothetical protein